MTACIRAAAASSERLGSVDGCVGGGVAASEKENGGAADVAIDIPCRLHGASATAPERLGSVTGAERRVDNGADADDSAGVG